MYTLTNKHIFVIEDNLENRIITRLAMAQSGAYLEFDIWGRQILPKLRQFAPIDLIILDLMFPMGVSGYDVYDQIREEEMFAETPIVAVSAADPSNAIPKCRAKGFAGFIAKPIDGTLFAEQIAQVIHGEAIWFDGINLRSS